MKCSSNATVGVLLAVAFVVSGCRIGTDVPGEEPAELEMREAEAIVAALVSPTLENTVFSTNHASFVHEHGEAGLHSHPTTGPWVHEEGDDGPYLGHHNLFVFNLVLEPECSGGGSVLFEAEVTGEGNPAVEPGVVHYVMVQTHTACAIAVAGGETFLIEAAPYLTVESHATNSGGTSRIYGSIVGSLSWQAEAKGGSCSIDVAWDVSAPALSELDVVPITGSFCELDIDTATDVD